MAKNNLDIEFDTRWHSSACITVKGNGTTENYDNKVEGDTKIELDVVEYDKDKKWHIPDNYINQIVEIAAEMHAFNKGNDEMGFVERAITYFNVSDDDLVEMIFNRYCKDQHDCKYLIEQLLYKMRELPSK